jgi:hypothetical protein
MNTNTPISTKCRVNAFMLCDGVHVDPATGKHSLLGIFSSLKGKSFPVIHPKMVWFLSLSELTKGEHKLKMSLADPTGELDTRVIVDRVFEAPDPRHRVNLVNDIHRLRIIEAKNYSIVIEVDDEIVFVDTLVIKDEYKEIMKKMDDLIDEYDYDYEDDEDESPDDNLF